MALYFKLLFEKKRLQEVREDIPPAKKDIKNVILKGEKVYYNQARHTQWEIFDGSLQSTKVKYRNPKNQCIHTPEAQNIVEDTLVGNKKIQIIQHQFLLYHTFLNLSIICSFISHNILFLKTKNKTLRKFG